MFALFSRVIDTIETGLAAPFRWLGRKLLPLARHNRKSIGEIAVVVESIATSVESGTANILPILDDAQAAMVAAKAFSGVIGAVVPGAAQGLAIASVALEGVEAVVREAGVVAHVIVVTASDLAKLDGVLASVRDAFVNSPGISVMLSPVAAQGPDDPNPIEGGVTVTATAVVVSADPATAPSSATGS